MSQWHKLPCSHSLTSRIVLKKKINIIINKNKSNNNNK